MDISAGGFSRLSLFWARTEGLQPGAQAFEIIGHRTVAAQSQSVAGTTGSVSGQQHRGDFGRETHHPAVASQLPVSTYNP